MPRPTDRYGTCVRELLADLSSTSLTPDDWQRLTPLLTEADARLSAYRAAPGQAAAIEAVRAGFDELAAAVAEATGKPRRSLKSACRGLTFAPQDFAAQDAGAGQEAAVPEDVPEPLRIVCQRMIYGADSLA